MTTLVTLVSGLAALALTACMGTDGVGDSSQPAMASQDIEAEAEVGGAEGRRDGHGPLDSARFIEKFDKDKNGTVELSELPERKQKWLAKADANNDGKITADELKAAGAARQERRFKDADKNSDGALTSDEVGERRWEGLRAADADGNSRVTLAEIQQARAAGKLHVGKLHEGRGKGPKGDHGRPDPEALIKRLDKDGSGALETAELPERMGKLMERADANKDGKLTADELKQHAAERHGRSRDGKGRRGGGAPEEI